MKVKVDKQTLFFFVASHPQWSDPTHTGLLLLLAANRCCCCCCWKSVVDDTSVSLLTSIESKSSMEFRLFRRCLWRLSPPVDEVRNERCCWCSCSCSPSSLPSSSSSCCSNRPLLLLLLSRRCRCCCPRFKAPAESNPRGYALEWKNTWRRLQSPLCRTRIRHSNARNKCVE